MSNEGLIIDLMKDSLFTNEDKKKNLSGDVSWKRLNVGGGKQALMRRFFFGLIRRLMKPLMYLLADTDVHLQLFLYNICIYSLVATLDYYICLRWLDIVRIFA